MIIRRLNATESPAAITFYFTLFGIILMGLLCLPVFRLPEAGNWWILALMGLAGGMAQYLMTASYSYAQVSMLAPYGYAMLVWSIGLQYIVWRDAPIRGGPERVALNNRSSGATPASLGRQRPAPLVI